MKWVVLLSDTHNGLDGFDELIKEIEIIIGKVTDEGIKRKAMEAGAEIVVRRTKKVLASHRRSGDLEDSIGYAYNEKTKSVDVGWGGKLNEGSKAHGYYGPMLDNGYNHVGGQHIQIPHLKASYEAELPHLLETMVEVYENALR